MMNSEQKHTDFSLYTFEEFLQNDFFISSMNHPTEETQKFWDEFEQMNPSNIDEYIAAKRYLEVFSKEKEEVLSNEETDDLWIRIQATNINKEKAKRKNYFLIGLSSASKCCYSRRMFLLIKELFFGAGSGYCHLCSEYQS